MSFKLGAEDAWYLAREFAPQFSQEDFTSLAHHEIYLRMMVNGVTSAPFSGTTLPPSASLHSYREQIVRLTRERYARRRGIVEQGAARHFLSSRGMIPQGPRVPVLGARKAERCFPAQARRRAIPSAPT